MDDAQMMDVTNDSQQQAAIEAIPRLNGSLLHSGNFSNSEVSIVGKVIGSDNNDDSTVTFEASDGQKFVVKINPQEPFDGYQSKYIEVRGAVQSDGSILQSSFQEYGNEFAMNTWDKFVQLTHQFPELF